MASDLAWALVAAVILGVVGLMFRRPRALLAARTRGWVRQAKLRLYLQHRDDTERAIERIAAELTQRRCMQEGNPDDEFSEDWYRWFTGDPNADVDYGRKQQRDRERLERGDFRTPIPRPGP